MEILMLTNKMPYPPKDGGAIATLSMAKSFAELGHNVTMLVMNTSKHYYDIEQVPDELAKQIEFVAVDVNTDLSVWQAFKNLLTSSIPYNAQRFISRKYDMKLAELLSSGNFDVIQFEGPYLGPYIRTVRKHSKAMLSMRAHNVEHQIWEQTAKLSKGIRGIYMANLAKRIKRFETSMMNYYDVMIPITHRDSVEFKNLGCKIPMLVAPTGINTEAFEPGYNNIDHPSLFHLGALDWPPNQEGLKWFFKNVWSKIIKEFPDLKFYLAGRNAPPQFSKLSATNLEFLGEIEDAHEFIRSKSIMVVPLFSGSGLRIKIIEGMALGKAIITTSVGKEGIECTHMENIIVADKPEEFLEAVRYLLSGKEKVIEIGRNARKFVNQHYDNLKITKALHNFYAKHIP